MSGTGSIYGEAKEFFSEVTLHNIPIPHHQLPVGHIG